MTSCSHRVLSMRRRSMTASGLAATLLSPHMIESAEERADIMTKAMTKGGDDYFKFRNDIMNIN
jgi:hypothetical protein